MDGSNQRNLPVPLDSISPIIQMYNPFLQVSPPWIPGKISNTITTDNDTSGKMVCKTS
jgi:hypothetical protein